MGGGEKMLLGPGEGIGEIGEVVLFDICHLLCFRFVKGRGDMI